jgi:hypothetical protein
MKFVILLLLIFRFTGAFADNCEPVITSVKTTDPSLCKLQKYSNVTTALLAGNVLGWPSFFKHCPEDKTATEKKINFTTEPNKEKCTLIKTFQLSKEDHLNLQDPKCMNALNQIMDKAMHEKINTVKANSFSEYCEPNKLVVDGYCCKE